MVELGDQTRWHSEGMERLRYEYDLNYLDVVFDLGSYNREFASEIIKRYGCKVECFDALDNNAAWVFDGEIEMGGQFYYTSMYDKGELGPVRTVKCVDIARLVNSEIGLMKINIEGGEYQVLSHLIFNDKLKHIRNLQVQFHLVSGMNCKKEYELIAGFLSKTHTLDWREPFVWESWKRNDSYLQDR